MWWEWEWQVGRAILMLAANTTSGGEAIKQGD